MDSLIDRHLSESEPPQHEPREEKSLPREENGRFAAAAPSDDPSGDDLLQRYLDREYPQDSEA